MVSKLEFVRDLKFEYGEANQVTPLVRRVIAHNPSAFTFYGTGTYIIGRGNVAVIDPGPLIESHVDALLAAVADEKVTHILITHTHNDHSPAAAPFKVKTGAPTYGYGPHMPGKYWEEAGFPFSLGGDRDFSPDHVISDGDTIEGDGWTLDVFHTPGHTSNHLCFGLKEENALFSGDHVMGWSTTVVAPPDGDMLDYIKSCKRLLLRHEDIFWPTHGPQITSPSQYLEALIGHRMHRENEISRALSTGLACIPDIVAKLYDQVPRHLHGAAAQTVLSHLIHMIQTGRVVCEDNPTTKTVFALAG